ncbi:carbohydrate ABC transporter permease [Georgenia alba]|uniref:Carbohydrate ABC transporter permease n=1 Tax=Georgenia alba TaxID=2233858 RepID=A0ABW2Q3P0_9MICO
MSAADVRVNRTGWRSPIHRSERRTGLLMIVPTVVLFAAFVGYPILRTIYLSLTEWSGFGEAQFVGLDNFTRMIGDSVARQSFVNILLFTLATTVLQTVVALLVAVVINTTWPRFAVLVRTILFIPAVISFVVTGVVWRLLLDPNLGTLNQVLRAVGLDGLATAWLAERSTAMVALIAVALWQSLGLNVLIYFAGLQGIDPTLYEAAEVDGANARQKFWFVTVPSLRTITALVVSLSLINGFKTFDLVFVLTGGGPNHATDVLGTYLYNLAFGSTAGSIPQFGYASAISVLVMALCTVAVVVQMALTRRADR